MFLTNECQDCNLGNKKILTAYAHSPDTQQHRYYMSHNITSIWDTHPPVSFHSLYHSLNYILGEEIQEEIRGRIIFYVIFLVLTAIIGLKI